MPPEKQSLSLGFKILIGLAVLTLLGVGTAVLLSALLAWWVFTTGDQRDTRVVIGEQSVAALHLGDMAEDPGASAMVEASLMTVMAASNRVNAEQLPPEMQWIHSLQQLQAGQASWGLRYYMPRSVTLVIDEDAEGIATTGAAVNFRGFVRVIRTLFEMDPDGQMARDGRLYTEGERSFVALSPDRDFLGFDGGTMVWSDRAPEMRTLLGRLDDPAQPALAADLEALRADWLAAGVTRQPARALSLLEPETAAGLAMAEAELGALDFQRGWMGARVLDADTAELAMALEGGSPQWVAELEPVVTAICQELLLRTEEAGMTGTCQARASGGDVTLDARITGVQAALARSLEEDLRQQRRPDP